MTPHDLHRSASLSRIKNEARKLERERPGIPHRAALNETAKLYGYGGWDDAVRCHARQETKKPEQQARQRGIRVIRLVEGPASMGQAVYLFWVEGERSWAKYASPDRFRQFIEAAIDASEWEPDAEADPPISCAPDASVAELECHGKALRVLESGAWRRASAELLALAYDPSYLAEV